MKVIQLTSSHLPLLRQFCIKCDNAGLYNNSSIEKLNMLDVAAKSGAYFGIIEDDEIVSIAGCYEFEEYKPNTWRIFYRSATLPGKAKNSGLHKGIGQRGKLYVNEFIKYTNSTELYLTTNITNDKHPSISIHNKTLTLTSTFKDTSTECVGPIHLHSTPQMLWKLNVNHYLQRLPIDNN